MTFIHRSGCERFKASTRRYCPGRNHLLEIDHDTLREVCVEADFAPVFPVNPRRLLRAIC